jgi:hypothetical protein
VVDDRHQVRGPADVTLDPPDACLAGGIEGRQGIFQNLAVVVLPAVGDDLALVQCSLRGPAPGYGRHHQVYRLQGCILQ